LNVASKYSRLLLRVADAIAIPVVRYSIAHSGLKRHSHYARYTRTLSAQIELDSIRADPPS